VFLPVNVALEETLRCKLRPNRSR